MVKALKGAGFTPKALIEHYGITDAAFVNELHKDADGVMGISVWLPNAPYKDDLFGSAQDYAAAFKKAYGAEPDYTAAGCSAAGYVLVKALEQLGDKPGLSESAKAKLNTLIAKTDLTAFYGPIKFESSGKHFHDNSAMKPFLVQIQDGQVKPIAPPEAARSKAVYPMKAWKDR
jgi:branched-chain amino acid transport system substrate-binding protein